MAERPPPGDPVEAFVQSLVQLLGEQLDAVYRYGAAFGRGPEAPRARLLILIKTVDVEMLQKLELPVRRAREQKLLLRVNTAPHLLQSADVFPVLALELIDTKELLHGRDVLAALEVHPRHLRLRIEQTLRTVRRDLIDGFLETADEARRARTLRLSIRKAIYLLRALAMIGDLRLPEAVSVEDLVESVTAEFLPEGQTATWQRLQRFAAFELSPGNLTELYGQTIDAISLLTDVVDKLDE